MTTMIYYNPKCSKCRQTLALLDENGVEAEVVEYLQSPPDARQLEEILNLLGLEPRGLMRTHEAPYKDNNLDNPELSREQLIAAMIDNPILIERPIVVSGGKARLGRPPELVIDIL